MTALIALKLAMIATGLLVAPFHRFAAVYVGCYAVACLVRLVGVPEASVNLLWHSGALVLALCIPMLRTPFCLLGLALFVPLIAIDVLRLQGAVPAYDAWWTVYWLVMAQLAALPFGVDSRRIAALREGGISAWRSARFNDFLRVAQ